MNNVIKLRKGLDIRLVGTASGARRKLPLSGEYALLPSSFTGLAPKVVVREGDAVKAGDAVFVDKRCPSVRCVSPVSGVVKQIERGERRRLLSVRISPDKKQTFTDFGRMNPAKMTAEEITSRLCEAGMIAFINQLPYAVVACPEDKPKAIFVSALRDMPLECDFETELKGAEADFQTGLTALSRIAKTYLGAGSKQTAKAILDAKDAEVNVFDGKCPAGNVGVQVNHISPVNKGEVVWTVEPTAVLFIGRLFNTGHVDLTRTVAVAGSEVKNPCFVDCLAGTPIADILSGQLKDKANSRIIDGNPLTGKLSSTDGFLGAHTSAVCVIPEGNRRNELLGWIMPRLKDFSTSRSYFSWLQGKRKAYNLDARVKGGERRIIMSGEYDRVLPMDIFGEYLIKAIISGNIDRQEALGIYEVAPEDFAVAEFVCSGKLELQKIVREGLDILRKENA
ncbi:MAG: Na(+)-translocating NADH-quinone reductase subunit A [Prevotella sp.]|nr:Na(+)-translocating NADH-quinone reductase subunit A [Prevotella sp.]